MIILKQFFHEESVAVVNAYVYDSLVPVLEFGQRPSEDVFHQITGFMASALESFKFDQTLSSESVTELLEQHFSGLLAFMHDSPVTHVQPQESEFPYEEFNSGMTQN